MRCGSTTWGLERRAGEGWGRVRGAGETKKGCGRKRNWMKEVEIGYGMNQIY
jgi:hypothetical protein